MYILISCIVSIIVIVYCSKNYLTRLTFKQKFLFLTKAILSINILKIALVIARFFAKSLAHEKKNK